MKFLACLLLAIGIRIYIAVLGFITHFTPWWVDIIVSVSAMALAIHFFTEVGRK